MRIAQNNVYIDGILSENNLEYGSFQKNGVTTECIRGSVTILVHQTIDDVPADVSVPVHFFATKLTKSGGPNPAYESIETAMKTFVSIAKAGSEDEADRVRISKGRIEMNEYFNADGKLISFPRITASFINKINKSQSKPEAAFNCEMVIAAMDYEVDAQGEPTGRYKVKGIIPKFGDKIDIVDFVCTKPKTIDGLMSYWSINDTVSFRGRLNFTVQTETIQEEMAFGDDPITRQRTRTISDLIITSGNMPLEGDLQYDLNDIQAAITERKQRLEAQKTRDMEKAKARTAPAPANEVSHGALDLGF